MRSATDRAAVLRAHSVTGLPLDAAGAVLVAGSHGGVIAVLLALRAGVRACILHDAGIGRDDAGIAGLVVAERHGVAAATVAQASCQIGDADDVWARGRISRANAVATAAGVAPGLACADAAMLLAALAPLAYPTPPLPIETRLEITRPGQRRIVLADSASMVHPEDAGAIVVTGSHGALMGGVAAAALKAEAFAAIFNDAGGAADGSGTGRLPALEARGIAAMTVGAHSARIGEAQSTFADGVVSAANGVARARGASIGAALRPLLEDWARRA